MPNIPTPFAPVVLGGITAANRIVMAPMTRSRAVGGTPNEATVDYYTQRASAGLIITEGIQPSAIGQGYPDTPGLHDEAQIGAWRRVTDSVHAAGGRIVAQLMHSGRIGHPTTSAAAGNGPLTPVAPSPVRPAGTIFTPEGPREYVTPRELTHAEIDATIADFASAAANAIAAGFDGVEVHAANGYLLHQFLAPNSNTRIDSWGGEPQNRIRFTLEVVRAVVEAIGAERTGIRISPANGLGDTHETDAAEVYPLLVSALDGLALAYLHVVEAGAPELLPELRELWHGVLILNPVDLQLDAHPARLERIASGEADLISFGRLFISNPDLVARLEAEAPLAEPDMSKAYGGDQRGYSDYPARGSVKAADVSVVSEGSPS